MPATPPARPRRRRSADVPPAEPEGLGQGRSARSGTWPCGPAHEAGYRIVHREVDRLAIAPDSKPPAAAGGFLMSPRAKSVLVKRSIADSREPKASPLPELIYMQPQRGSKREHDEGICSWPLSAHASRDADRAVLGFRDRVGPRRATDPKPGGCGMPGRGEGQGLLRPQSERSGDRGGGAGNLLRVHEADRPEDQSVTRREGPSSQAVRRGSRAVPSSCVEGGSDPRAQKLPQALVATLRIEIRH